jgi:RNA-directed DNA polymerase
LIDNIPVDKTILQKWLKAGFVYQKQLFPTEAGTPQGGIISPALANMTLDGLEYALAKAFPYRIKKGLKMNMVRYCDDFIITGYSKEWLEQEVMPVLVSFLAKRGLILSPEKTRITHITEGFDFLGWNIRKYHGKLLMKPSKANTKAHLFRVQEIIKANKTAKQMSLIGLLNPVLRGWANYHCHIVAKKTFSWIDSQVWSTLWRWAKRRHPNKSARWVKAKYFKTRGYRDWMFTAVDESNKHKKFILVLEADTSISRHIKINSMANPHDPAWKQYFEARRKKQKTKSTQRCCRVPQGAFAEA